MARCPHTPLGEMAIRYSVAWLGDELATAAENAGFGVIRSDNRALYPRSSPILRWLEQCAIWCCDGWRAGQPRMGKLAFEGADRKSVVKGKRVSVRVDMGGRRIIKK